jgi:hypothetical protein
MFTVKLYSGTHLKIVQTKMVDVYKERSKQGEIELVTDEASYFIAAVSPKDMMKNTIGGQPDFWDSAYIENERGATTQRITPKMVLA